jgi:hypothetical protein
MVTRRATRRVRRFLTVAAAGLACTSVAEGLPAQLLFPAHLMNGLNLVNGMVAQTNANNSYSYTLPPTISRGPTTFACAADCSSVVSLLLEHTYGLSAANIKTLAGTTKATGTIASWPQSATWYAAVTAGTPGTCMPAIATLSAVLPGDFIFVKYTAGNSDPDGDTGHCMLVAGTPQPLSATDAPVEAGCSEWSVQVVDVTGDPHTSDTRYQTNAAGNGTNAAGVGSGTIRVYVNADGTTAGYSWGLSSASTFEPMSARPLVFARPSATALANLAAGGTVQPAAKATAAKSAVRTIRR